MQVGRPSERGRRGWNVSDLDPRIEAIAKRVLEGRACSSITLPTRASIRALIDELIQVLFPHFSGRRFDDLPAMARELDRIRHLMVDALTPIPEELPGPADDIAVAFLDEIPGVLEHLCMDAEAIYQGDPAAESVDEVILAYPGFYAIAVQRLAHRLYRMKVPLLPRIMTEYAHSHTGVDIHPGATIGKSFCIDHGTSVVIGETAVLGERVKLYQGVTLGALSVEKRFQDQKRHPTLEDRVIVYANATILGGNTTVGHDSIIGGNVWLTKSVPPHTRVYHRSDIHFASGSDYII